MNLKNRMTICLGFLLAALFISSGAFAITCSSDTTKTITLGSSELITVSCSSMSSGDNVEVTHSGYNPSCLTASTASKTLTYAAPSTTFSFNGLSTACQGNVAERTIGWSFDDGTNTYSSSTVVTLSPLEISAAFSSSSISKTTANSAFYITLTVSNAGTTSVNDISVTETTSTGILDSKTISSISGQSSQSVSWSVNPATVGVGVYSITAKALAATTDPATDSMTLTITSGGSSSSSSTGGGENTPSSSSGGGGGGAFLPTNNDNKTSDKTKQKDDQEDTDNVTKSNRPEIVPGVGLRDNEKLQAAIEKVLAKGKMSENAVQNMLRLSAAITSDIEADRNIETTSQSSKITTKMKYNGNKKAKNFVVYEKVPKTFAESADQITVTTNGNVEVVNPDPEYAIVFSELNPGQTVEISYAVNAKVDTSVIDEMSSEIYAESLEDTQASETQPDTGGQAKDTDNTNTVLILLVLLLMLMIAGYVFYKSKRKNANSFKVRPIQRPREEKPQERGEPEQEKPKEEKPQEEREPEQEKPKEKPQESSTEELNNIKDRIDSF